MRGRSVAALLLLACACQRPAPAAKPGQLQPVGSGPLEQARVLIEQGQPDEALVKLQEAPADADSLYYQGVAWAKKAETAPLPTPPPAPSPLPRAAQPPAAPEFKPEELTALDFFDKALAARSDHAKAQLALAELLAPHAIHRYEREEAARKARPSRRGREAAATPAAEAGPDSSPERVLGTYRAAWQADPKPKEAVEGLVRFAARVGRLDEAEAGLQELTRREPEKPEPFIRYADFLANDKKDPLAAVEQYKQALVWRAEDDLTRAKIADIYIAMGVEHWKAGQYGAAESRFREAQKFVTDRTSPQGQQVLEYLGKLRTLRQR